MGKGIGDAFSRRNFLKSSLALGLAGLVSTNRELLAGSSANKAMLVPVMLTPFREDLSLDTYGLERLIEFYLESGAGGLFANCLSSEMYQLSRTERLEVTALTVNHAGSGVPVIATGSFGEAQEDRIQCVTEMAETGVDAVVLITSHFAEKGQDERFFLDHVLGLVDRTPGISLGTYESPSPYKRLLSASAFGALNDTKRFTYHKDTSENIEQLIQKIEISKGGPYQVFSAHSGTAVPFIRAGGSGLSPIAGNFFPEIFAWICKHAQASDLSARVDYLQRELIRAEQILSHKYPLSAKYFLQKRGLPILVNSRMRSGELTKTEMVTLDTLYGDFEVWCSDLGISPVKIM